VGGSRGSGSKRKAGQLSTDDEDDNEESEGEKGGARKKTKKGKSIFILEVLAVVLGILI
jgi:hypothetical protein